ncbi:hypothetical protein VNO78_01996 [Psophocarpus tetragonolobus]|uniref:Programmed cell death protein 2 C-terminal domain-containing protein n=1 Tax=Psophocarpus tetragonolobus TaxID=3891 RepID=A0AAN9T252_PSOTE
MGGTLLGLPGPWAEDYREPADPYTTKIGGLPDWPLPVNADLLRCAACASQLCLVAQVYAPLSQHRSLFVLGCVSPECGTAWRVLRVQNVAHIHPSPQNQPAWVAEAPRVNVSDDEDMDLEQLGKALFEAATLASNTNRKKPRKKRQTKLPSSSPHPKPATVVQNDVPVVPCFYIYPQEESSSAGDISSSYSSLSIKGSENDVEDSDPSEAEQAWEKEQYEYDKALTADRTYLKFKKRLDAYPKQCFRYSYCGKPILAAADEINPGNCKLCGSPRQFEMQLMPPLLYFLQEALGDRRHLVKNWDWMTLVVYTCSESCCVEIEHTKSNMGWIVTEESVVAQCEESIPIQPSYFS